MNIGNPDEITIGDFAEEIIKLTGTLSAGNSLPTKACWRAAARSHVVE
jgi:nucleoside-diphosphate-sugar epimerase